jgi:acylpyruvate hydrolase
MEQRMKLLTYRAKDQKTEDNRLGVILPGRDENLILDLSAYVDSISLNTSTLVSTAMNDMLSFLSAGEVGFQTAKSFIDHLGRSESVSEVEEHQQAGILIPLKQAVLAPPITRPGKMICAGFNFLDHVSEGAAETPEIPEFPMGFIKVSTSLIGHDQSIVLPAHSQEVDYEIEIAVVIGQPCKEVTKDNALEYVAGYCVFNDVSARDIQFREMKKGLLTLGKNFDTFAPLGPWIVTHDEVPNPQDLRLELRINGEIRQRSNTSYMIYSIPELIAYWSRMTLEPGDVIACGTPSGVAAFREPDPRQYYLKPGDVVEAWVERIGTLRNMVIAAETIHHD